jgi:transposase
MRVPGSGEELERRRRRALALLDEGRTLREVARMVGCQASSVMRWRNVRKKSGEKGLRVRRSPGRPRKLSEGQSRRLIRQLLKGAHAYGYSTDLWTTARIAEVIEKMFGVRYDRDHVGRLMHRLGWSHQKPTRRALERDEAAIEQWRRRHWPQVKKTPRGWVPTSSS